MSTPLEQQARELAARLLGFAAHQDDITLILAALKRVRNEGADKDAQFYKDLVFDGWAVFKALTERDAKFTSYESVAATLDALNRVARQRAARPTPEKESP